MEEIIKYVMLLFVVIIQKCSAGKILHAAKVHAESKQLFSRLDRVFLSQEEFVSFINNCNNRTQIIRHILTD